MNKCLSALVMGISAIAAIVLNEPVTAAPSGSPQEIYIRKYSAVAVSEMYRSGIPASITLAQGLLESGNGRSELAVKANNHFGIKCHDWKGPAMYFDDDRKGECFRKYEHAEASFKDHSDFLRYRDRYKFLFELETTDYKGWAYGLKKAGYATDPKYPQKLIKLIEDYDLARFDTASMPEDGTSVAVDKAKGKKDRQSTKKASRKSRGKNKAARSGASRQVPEAPSVLEAPVPMEKGSSEKFSYSLSRQMYSLNKVPFVYSIEGETYASIAKYYNLFLPEILKYNDLSSVQELAPGTIVYLQAKKKKAAKMVDKYVAEGGESLRDISQRFGVRMASLQKINGIDASYIARPEDTIRLR